MEEFRREDINIKEWEYEFRQRDTNPIIIADFWSRAIYFNLESELNLPARYLNYLFTDSNCGYVKIKEKEKVLNLIRGAIEKGNYLKYIYDATLLRVAQWKQFSERVRSKLKKSFPDRKEILNLWRECDRKLLLLIPWFYIPWYVTENNMISQRIRERLEKHRSYIEKYASLDEAVMIISFPVREALFQKEQSEFMKLLGMAKDDFQNDPKFLSAAKNYLDEYGWTKTFLLLPKEPLTFEELLKRINNARKNNALADYKSQKEKREKDFVLARKLLDGLKNDSYLVEQIGWAREFGWLLTFSVEQAFKSGAKLIPFYKILAKEISVPYEDWVYLTSAEIIQALEGSAIPYEEIKNRKDGFAFLLKKGIVKIASGEKGKKLSEWIDKNAGQNVIQDITEIKGQSAMPGVMKGRVHIALLPADSHNLEAGEILVCSMTSPEYLPAMRRAAAFVTDEGGLLSHAAIIARELGKPCIVGTKIATKVLKDGQLVEVDANKGIVRILTK